MKKVALSFSILAVAALFTVTSCKKDKNVAPEPDKELQSSLDVSYALMAITDIEQVCGFAGENQLFPKFYLPAAHSTGTLVPSRDTVQKYLKESWNNTDCLDGKRRNGSFFINYDWHDNPNAKYYHDPGFEAKISLVNYSVDGWNINTVNGSQIIVTNMVPPTYSPQTTNLSWNFYGDVTLKNQLDSTKDMHVNFNLTKTLLNTSTPTVFPVNKQSSITWTLGIVSYKGTVYGETSRNVKFSYKIDETHQLCRNFTCAPDKVYGIAVTPSVSARIDEYHPFINGSASFTTASLYPRVIHYGPEDAVPNSDAPCDHTGAVTIKGISYPVTFIKKY